MNHTFVSTIAWISRGYPKKIPKQIEFTNQQVQEMKNDPLIKKNLNKNIDQLHQIDIQEDQGDNLPIFTAEIQQMRNEEQDNDKYPMALQQLQDDQKQDYYIKESDALIVAGKVQKQYSSLEIYIYQQDQNNLFVHHEIMLSSFPLDIQWLNADLSQISMPEVAKGNYAIVSTFLPEIQIWDLDLSDAIQPVMILGGQIQSKTNKPKKFKNKNKKFKKGSHTDSVLSLSLNKFHKNILASGSADTTVKIWDLSKGENIYSISHHTDRVQKVEWSPIQQTILITAGFDQQINILDSRYPNDKITHKTAEKQLQSVCINPNSPSQIAYTTQKGNFYLFDAKMPNKYIFNTKIHQESATGCRISKKNMAATCSEDGTVKIWDIFDLDNNNPRLIHTQNPKCGKLFCVQFYEDSEVLCCGNGNGELFIWDTYENKTIENYFSKYN